MEVVDNLRERIEGGEKAPQTHFTEDESLFRLSANVTYSFSKKDSDRISLRCRSWISDVVLCPYFVSIPEGSKKEKGSLGAKALQPLRIAVGTYSPFEYEEDKSPVLGYDVEINKSKGRFEMQPIYYWEYDEFGKRDKMVYKHAGEYKKIPAQQVRKKNPAIIIWKNKPKD